MGAVIAFAGAAQSGAQTFHGPLPYTCETDSPFNVAPYFLADMCIVDFESGGLPLGVIASGGSVLSPDPSTHPDSVDCDDGVIDGSGATGSSWSDGSLAPYAKVEFSFDPAVFTNMPTHVGIVWTDAYPTVTDVRFTAWAADGSYLGNVLGTSLGDGDPMGLGKTAEDRFFGVFHAGGISKIRLQILTKDCQSTQYGTICPNFLEVDHLQFGCGEPNGVTQPPQSVTVACGQPAQLSFELGGCSPFFAVWSCTGCGPGGTDMSFDQHDSTLSVSPQDVIEAAGDPITVTIYMGCGPPIVLGPYYITTVPAIITQEPADVTVCPPEPASISVGASGAGLQYQWYRQCPGSAATKITGAVGAVLNDQWPAFWEPLSSDCGCEVYCVITKPGCGSVQSLPATIHCCDCVRPPPTMALWLPFDETSGTLAHNAVGGFNGVYQPFSGGPFPWVGYYAGNSLFFDGQDDFVRVNHHWLVDVSTGDLTLDAWIFLEMDVQGVWVIVDKREEQFPSTRGYHLFLSDGQLGFQLADGTHTNWVAPGGTWKITPGQWRHVAVTVDRDQTNGGRFYIDGVHVSTFDPTGRQGDLSNSKPFTVGARSTTPSGFFLGGIDEVELFRRALDPGEIVALAAAKGVGKCKRFCQVAQPLIFCKDAASTGVAASMFNATPQGVNVNPFLGWMTGPAACTFGGPYQSAEAISIPPVFWSGAWSKATVTATAPKPAAMTVANSAACFSAQFYPTGGSVFPYFTCEGTIVNRPDLKCWCPECPSPPPMQVGEPATVFLGFGNAGVESGNFPYTLEALGPDGLPSQAMSIYGLPPGTVLEGTLNVPMGSDFAFALEVTFEEIEALGATTLVLSTDTDGDGVYEPAASAVLLCEAGVLSEADFDGNGVVDGSDLGVLLSGWGTAGPGDLDGDGVVGGADLGLLLGEWGG